jgi:carnitine O-acetyltransferase
MSSKPILQFTRPANWKELAPEALPGSLTYAASTKLPKLPVPNLPDTLTRLKETLKPIAWSEEEFQAVSKKIDAFADSQGPELHKRLLKRDAETKHWLESWWDDIGYLGYRDSVRTPPHLALVRR